MLGGLALQRRLAVVYRLQNTLLEVGIKEPDFADRTVEKGG
jgi:hypothetical protein